MNENTQLQLRGIEADNLLAILALMGLLRALEHSQPSWKPRVAWAGPPWRATLRINAAVDEDAVAIAADKGILDLVKHFDVDQLRDVSGFDGSRFRAYLARVAANVVTAQFAASFATEFPAREGKVAAAPLVMMFGQGHQHFLERIVAVPASDDDGLGDPARLKNAVFSPWKRADETDGFRWDPDEDQRYALQYRNPSRAGAACTEHGANRLAAIGLLSFPCMPTGTRLLATGHSRAGGEHSFVWPIWGGFLSRQAIEDLLAHPALIDGRTRDLAAYGVREILRARRISNGKFMNVTRAAPVVSARR